MSNTVRRATILVGAVAALTAWPSAGAAQAGGSRLTALASLSTPEVARLRQATQRFRDVKVALAEGYLPDPSGMCITSAMEGQPRQLGAMGIHYFRPDLLGLTSTAPRVAGTGTHTDFARPSVLIYEPQANGGLELVAIENLVFEKAWKEAGNTAAPSFMGHEYFHMVDNPLTPMDEAHGFEPHYELHFWLYRENPAGPFMPFNTRASCPNPTAVPHAGHGTK